MKKLKEYQYKCKLCKYKFKDTIERFNNDNRQCPLCKNNTLVIIKGYNYLWLFLLLLFLLL